MDEPLSFLPTLKNIPRAGWLQAGIGLSSVESVSEHSFDVASMAMVFCDVLNSKGRKLDHEKTVKAAILHDWAEVIIMDQPRSVKELIEEPKSIKRAERKALNRMLKKMPELRSEYLGLWDLAHSDTDEGNLVKLADLYSMYLQAKMYIASGSRDKRTKQIRDSAKQGIKKRLAVFPELKPLVKI
jgi:5'-deoxynucleotidase YfbR-like HD superfamily hydrolase